MTEAVEKRGPGRPFIVPSPEAFEERASAYFQQCRADGEPVTMAGLAIALGLKNRQSIWSYGKREEYADVVSWAKLYVEATYERRLHGRSASGAIFALKNMGWSDRQEVEYSGDPANPIGLVVGRMSDDELVARARQITNRLTAIKGNGSHG